MTPGLEQQSFPITRWIRSCWECMSDGEPKSKQLQDQTVRKGLEREMRVCRNQPHLVPPMKMMVDDDLPSPAVHLPQSRSSLSSWIEEGRNFASRASERASMSWRRQTAAPLKISAPSDFRRVQSFQLLTTPQNFQPLQLSIHRSGNRLSDLPSFKSLVIDEDSQPTTLTVPSRALSPTGIRSRRCHSSEARFSVSRKPVGSASCRSIAKMEEPIELPRSTRFESALIPHFCTMDPVKPPQLEESLHAPAFSPIVPAVPVGSLHVSSNSGQTDVTCDGDPSIPNSSAELRLKAIRTPTSKEQDQDDQMYVNDSPSTASSHTMPSRISSLGRPSTTENRETIAPVPLPSRVAHWFFPKEPSTPNQVSLARKNDFDWARARTLSGTTVNSTITTITGGAMARRPNGSISSTFTHTTTPRTSLQGLSSTSEKHLEAGFVHPTTVENQTQSLAYSFPISNNVLPYRGSAIGVAF